MTSHAVNAHLQLVPLHTPPQAMAYIDEAIGLIADSGLAYQVGPFGTSIEGPLPQVLALVERINQHLHQQQAGEWLINLQVHSSHSQAIQAHQKTAKHQVNA
jgi:uncharacterized protein YqgV (UPF0045/DUF77 family)